MFRTVSPCAGGQVTFVVNKSRVLYDESSQNDDSSKGDESSQDDEDDSASQNDEAEPTALPDASDDDHVRQDIFSPILSEADPTSRRPNDTPEPDASDDDHVSQDIFSPMLNEAEPNPTSRPDASEEEEQESPISEGAQSNKHVSNFVLNIG